MGPFKSSGVGKRKEREEDTARLRVSGGGRKGRRKEERKARDVFFTLRKQTALLLQREGNLRGLCLPVSCDEEYTSLKLCAWYSPKPGQHIGRERQTKLVRVPKDLFHPHVNRVMQSPIIRSAIHHHTLILETASSACIMRVALVGCPSHTCGGSRGRDFGDLWRDLGRMGGGFVGKR